VLQGAEPVPGGRVAGCCGKIRGAAKLIQSELGIGKAPERITQERRQVCEGCEEWDHGRCRNCGCYTWAKTRLTKEACPLGKW
jgi:hypothetical protein